MKKYIIVITLLSSGLAHAMDEFTDMEGFIERQTDKEIQRKVEAKEQRREEMEELRNERYQLASMCWGDNYKGVKEYIESHPNVPASQYGFSLKDEVTTVRMAVLLESRGIKLNQNDKNGSLLHSASSWNGTPMLLKYAIRRYCKEEKTLDINAGKKIDGQTPLHLAADDADNKTTREKFYILLEAGADGTVKDKGGKTPLDILEHHLHVHRQYDHTEKITVYETLINDLKTAMKSKK
jgi:hypothetical protein